MMIRTLRSALSCAVVLCAAALGACSDSPTEGLRDESSDPVVAAANRNLGGSARVFQVSRDEKKSNTIQVRGLRPAAALYHDRLCTDMVVREYTFDDPCNNDPCAYDYYAPGCPGYVPDDPCYYNYYAYGCPGYVAPTPTPPTPTTVTAVFSYGSDASGISNITANNTQLKQLTLSSFSQAIQNVSFTTLDASFRNVGADTGCHLAAGQFDNSHGSGSGSPFYVSASRTPAWQGVIKWEVVGTHSFTPVSGASGGGTVYSSDFTCG